MTDNIDTWDTQSIGQSRTSCRHCHGLIHNSTDIYIMYIQEHHWYGGKRLVNLSLLQFKAMNTISTRAKYCRKSTDLACMHY